VGPKKKKLQPAELAHEQFQETEAFLRLARQDLQRNGVRNCEAIELGLRAALLRDGRRLLEQLYAQSELTIADNASRPGEKCHPQRSLRLHSIFGVIDLPRDYFYSPTEKTGRVPLDEALGLVESFSPALVRLAARAAAKEGYAGAADDLAALAGIAIEGRQIHRLVNAVGPSVATALEVGTDQAQEPIPVLYVEVDATGVPMVVAELEGRPGKQADGSSKTREVKLACFFTQTRPDPETGLPVRDPDSTTYVGSFENAQDFGARVRQEALRRGSGRARQIVVLGDGAAWIWELARVNFPLHASLVIWIVDMYHALERLHKLCLALYPQGDEAARIETQWTDLLKDDQVEAVITAARHRLQALGPQTNDELESQIGYFENQKSRMLYKTYRQQGLFYGSGVVEAGCKVVIGQRLKESGMFWTEPGGTNVVTLRCALKGNRWDEVWDRLHDSNYLKIAAVA
jgi:hypothetical protein